jgi:hypothetical protein
MSTRIGGASIAVALTALMLGGSSAMAATVAYTGSGAFSSISGCNSGSPGCSISNTSNGSNTLLDMSGHNNSTLEAIKITDSFSLTSPQNNVTIGELRWTNNASTDTDQNFNVTYTFTLSFTSPNNSSDSQAFTLNIQQPTNPPGDTVSSLSALVLSGLGPFTLNGVTMSDIHFATSPGSHSTYNSSTGTWYNPEGDTSNLLIEADFAPTATPLPATLPLFAGGLGFVGYLARRRKKNSNQPLASA